MLVYSRQLFHEELKYASLLTSLFIISTFFSNLFHYSCVLLCNKESDLKSFKNQQLKICSQHGIKRDIFSKSVL